MSCDTPPGERRWREKERERKGEEVRENEKRMCGVHRSARGNICVKRFVLSVRKGAI